MALSATVISLVSFALFLFIAVLGFSAFSEIDLVACSAQSNELSSARQYLLGASLINLIMMVVIIVAMVISFNSKAPGSGLLTRAAKVPTSFVVLALLYIFTFMLTCILSAIAYSKIVSANCNLSSLPAATINSLVLTVGSGLLVVFYILFLIVWYREELKELFREPNVEMKTIKSKPEAKASEAAAVAAPSKPSGPSRDEQANQGQELLDAVKNGERDPLSITLSEERLIQAAKDKKERIGKLIGSEKREKDKERKQRESKKEVEFDVPN